MSFYKLYIEEGKKKKYATGILITDYISKIINCDLCGRTRKIAALLDKDSDLQIALTNSYFADFFNVEYHTIVSEKAKEVLILENIQGYELGVLKIVSKSEILSKKIKDLRDSGYKVKDISDDPPIYYRLFVQVGAELHEESNIVLVEECNSCDYHKYMPKDNDYFHPNYIKVDSWNGNDIFRVKESSSAIYCSERFVEIYNKHKLSGLRFKEIKGL